MPRTGSILNEALLGVNVMWWMTNQMMFIRRLNSTTESSLNNIVFEHEFGYSNGFFTAQLSNQVEVEHVKEAFRLLSKSIIRVEQPDIHLDEASDLNEAHDTRIYKCRFFK